MGFSLCALGTRGHRRRVSSREGPRERAWHGCDRGASARNPGASGSERSPGVQPGGDLTTYLESSTCPWASGPPSPRTEGAGPASFKGRQKATTVIRHYGVAADPETPAPREPAPALHLLPSPGRVAQRESARLTRERSLVRTQPRPLGKSLQMRGFFLSARVSSRSRIRAIGALWPILWPKNGGFAGNRRASAVALKR